MKRFSLFLLLFALTSFFDRALGQQQAVGAYSISGRINDEINTPMPEVGIRILAAKDSAFVIGGKTDANGKFKIAVAKTGSYIVVP